MKERKFVLLVGVILLLISCSPTKKGFVKTGDNLDDAIKIAILDFSNTHKLLKKGNVFSIEVIGLSNNNDIMVVRIGKNNRKLLLTKGTTVGSKGKLPSRYVEKDGKLFFWWDDDYPLTEDALAVFNKYDILQDDKNGAIKIPDFIIADAQKNAHYYFCKEDLSKYKRVITNKGVGYYDAPNLNCNNNHQ